MPTETKAPKTTKAVPATTPEAKSPKARVQSFDIAKSDETLDLAKDLAKFIKDNKLSTQVQGKEFVNVEGWQYAGSRLGIVPIVEHVLNCGTDTELRYQAKITLFDLRHGVTVGAGFAVCSNKESGKKFYQEFAIMSMAQTRAVGKAYRNVLAWIIRAAGYEPTPAEEMDYDTSKAVAVAANPTTGSGGGSPSARPVASTTSVPNNARPIPQITQGPVNAPVMQVLPADEPQPGEVLPPVQFATADQKQEIQRLLNNPQITRPEKTKMLLNLNRLDEERARQAIQKLRLTIDDREAGGTGQQWRAKLQAYLSANKQRLGKDTCSRLAVVAHLPASTDNQLLNALAESHMLAEANDAAAHRPAEVDETAAA